MQESWEITKQLILAIAKDVESAGSKFAVMIVPHGIQVGQSISNLDPASFSYERLQRSHLQLEGFLQDNHIISIDLATSIRAEISRGKMLYYPKDGHWNQDGHRIVADVLFSWLMGTCPEGQRFGRECLPTSEP